MKITLQKKINKKEKNIGVEILRIYLSMLVVNSHCYRYSKNIKYIILKFLRNRLHVPTFFIISFYFFHNTLLSRNIDKFKQKYQRLLIPYFFWPVINWLINNLIMAFYNIKLKNSFKDLEMQLLTGHCFNEVFWFQLNLIFEVFFFIIIELICHKNLMYIIINLEILAYFFQYSQYNYKIFSKFNYERKYPFGRFSEIIPHSVSGFIISYLRLISYFKKNKIKVITICLFIFTLLFKYNFLIEPKGFNYQGLRLNILSICFFVIFSVISGKFISKYLNKLILLISKYTPGIYYLHIPIMNYFRTFINVIKNKELYGSILIYIICFNFSFIGNLIFKKTILVNLFQ